MQQSTEYSARAKAHDYLHGGGDNIESVSCHRGAFHGRFVVQQGGGRVGVLWIAMKRVGVLLLDIDAIGSSLFLEALLR